MHILISKINSLGDAVSFLPTVHGLRTAFPAASIVLACSTVTASLFQRSVGGIEVRTFEFAKVRRRSAALAAFWEALRRRGETFDLSLHSYDDPSFSYLLSRFSGIRRRIGFASHIARASSLLTETLPFGGGRNVVDLNFDLVRHVAKNATLMPTRVPIGFGNEEAAEVETLLKRIGYRLGQTLVVIHPYAKLTYKEWGIERFKQAASELGRSTGAFVVFASEKPDADLASVNHLHGLSIHAFAALCSRATLFIGNNSGPMNVAAAMGTSTLIAQGPSPPEWAVYWTDRPHVQLVARHLPCVPCESLKYVLGRCTNRENRNGCMHEITLEGLIVRAVEMISSDPTQRESKDAALVSERL